MRPSCASAAGTSVRNPWGLHRKASALCQASSEPSDGHRTGAKDGHESPWSLVRASVSAIHGTQLLATYFSRATASTWRGRRSRRRAGSAMVHGAGRASPSGPAPSGGRESGALGSQSSASVTGYGELVSPHLLGVLFLPGGHVGPAEQPVDAHLVASAGGRRATARPDAGTAALYGPPLVVAVSRAPERPLETSLGVKAHCRRIDEVMASDGLPYVAGGDECFKINHASHGHRGRRCMFPTSAGR